MAKLTGSQIIVLSAAASRDDGIAIIPAKMNKAAASKVGSSLVARKLMREARSKPGMPIWRVDKDDRPISLVITRAGRNAIGVDEDAAAEAPRLNNKAPEMQDVSTAKKQRVDRAPKGAFKARAPTTRRSLGRDCTLTEHVDDRTPELRIGEIGHATAGRHTPVALDRGADGVIQSILDSRRPRSAIADLGRAAHAGLVTLDALRLHDLLAATLPSQVFHADWLDPATARPSSRPWAVLL